jgi:hypothetical protein
MIKTICDRCGADNAANYSFSFGYTKATGGLISKNIDLCYGCSEVVLKDNNMMRTIELFLVSGGSKLIVELPMEAQP